MESGQCGFFSYFIAADDGDRILLFDKYEI